MSGVLRVVLATVALIAGPLLFAIATAWLQIGLYRLFRREPPVVPILMLRSLMLLILVVAGGVYWFRFGEGHRADTPIAPAGDAQR